MVPQCKYQKACVALNFVTMIFHGHLTDLPIENYSTLYVVVCRHQWLTVFH